MATLILAFAQLKSFTSLIIKHNEFLQNSMSALSPILLRPIGNNLSELRLVSLKTAPYVIDDLLSVICENCTLTKLGLVDC